MEVLDKEAFKSKIFDFEAQDTWAFKGSRPAIIDFYADWCAPCRALAPVLVEVAKQFDGKVDIFKVDTEASPEIAAIFAVQGIPSILFIPTKGDPMMSTGFMAHSGFEKAISDLFQIEP